MHLLEYLGAGHDRADGEDGSFPTNPSPGRNLHWVVLIAAVYFLTARLGLALALQPEGIAPVWIPSGIFLSAILITRRRLRPLLVVVLCLTDFLAERATGTPLVVSAIYALCLTGDAALSAWLLLKLVGSPITFERTRDVLGLIGLVVVASNAVFSLGAAAASTLVPGAEFWVSWRLWAASDGMGNLLVTPFIVSWASLRVTPRGWSGGRAAEGVALVVLLAVCNLVAISWFSASGLFDLLLPFSTFPFLLWAALRFGMRGTTAALAVIAAVLLPFASAGRLPVVYYFGAVLHPMLVVQVLLVLVAVPTLFVAAGVCERKSALERLAEKQALLDKAEVIAQVGSWKLDLLTNRITWSDEVYRLFGVSQASFEPTYRSFLASVHPEDRAAVDGAFSRSLVERRDSYEIGHRIVRPASGEVRYVYEKCEHTRDESGRVVHSVGIVRDVTEQMVAERALRESESRFRTIFENSPIAVWEEDFSQVQARFDRLRQSGVADLRAHLEAHPLEVGELWACVRRTGTGRPVLRVLGREDADIADLDLSRHFTAESWKVFEEELIALWEGRHEFRSENPMTTADGRPVVFDLTLSVLPGDERTLSRVLVSHADITERQRAEQAFRALSRKDEQALRAARMGHWEFDLASGLFTFNDQYYRLHDTDVVAAGGYQMSAEKFARTYVHPEDAHLVGEAIQRAMESDAPDFRTEARILAGSEVRKVAVYFRVEKDARGATVKLHGVNQDITERWRALDAIRERDRYIETILENAPIGFAVSTVQDGRNAFVGGRFEDIYGVPRGSLHTTEDFFEKVFSDPEQREALRERMLADIASGDPSRMRWEDVPITTASGERRFVTAINIPLPDQGLMVATVQDVTAHHRAEEALRDSEQRFRTLIEQAGDGFELVAQDGRYLDVNTATCRQLGRSREELLRMTVFDVDPLVTKELFAARAKLISEEPITFESVHSRADGSTFPIEVTISAIQLHDGPAALTLVRDITERKRTEREQEKLRGQLVQAQKMESVGRLAGGVAHDFNNMLGVILGNAELALSDPIGSESLRESLRQIQVAAQRSADLTRQLLAFARKQTIAPRSIDLNDAIAGTLKMLQRLIGEDIDLAWIPGRNLWPVRMDPAQLDQILANLCVNARDAIGGVGKVTIETARVRFDDAYCAHHAGFVPGPFARLAVSDNGCGMSRDVVDRIFEPFFTTKEVGRGTGLGLSTVYGIVKQNNGFVNVYSEVGQGTTFTIYLPAADIADGEVAASAADGAPQQGTETILLIEDEEMVLKLGTNILTSLGYCVLPAQRPADALRLAAEHDGPIHILITDVVMPEMNGRTLRDLIAERRPETRALFISGYTADAIAHHGVLEEGIEFLQKPFSMKALADKVRAILDQPTA